MKRLELLALGLRVVGIYGLLMGLQFAVSSYSTIQQFKLMGVDDDVGFWYLFLGAPVMLYYFAALALVTFPVSISKKLLPRSAEGDTLISLGASELQNVCFTVLGVYILSWAIPGFVHQAATTWQAVGMTEFNSSVTFGEHIVVLIVSALEIGIGLYLCLRASGLSKLIAAVRGYGYK